MIRSMTGYGAADRETAAGRLQVELKTVNHRYFSANLRLPAPLERSEPEIRERLRASLPRGHVSCSLRLTTPDSAGESAPPLRLDEARARQYLQVLRALKERLALPGEIDLTLLARFGDLILPAGEEEAPQIAQEELHQALDAALHQVLAMRVEEGRRLHQDLEQRLQAVERALDRIGECAPARLLAERDRLRRALTELAGDPAVDEDRLAREVALLAERWDISEEVVRLRSHIALFRELLEADGAEPVGKRLGFLSQEMHRETNTIGSKANDAAIEHQVVAIKNEIERLREQVENVE
ncbi:MAG: YicC family protein [Gemmatimonadetes bacterium]|nr:YicC family protein [Gemmatimonadota bacterium]